ncbi:MAG TPA: gluconate 2-dehydrogenase subunit 3 family protein [Steroidobacteraceae bacterium]|nr:gluconate 2-dehydrogenase subunit 3 family protein [Steroidobacteraceae bacterium]
MDRRQFLESIAGLSALLPGLTLQQAFTQQAHARARSIPAPRTLSAAQDGCLAALAEIILPRTETVGAGDVGVNRFIDLLLTESLLPADRDRLLAGLDAIDARSRARYGAPLARARAADQLALIGALDAALPPRDPTRSERAALEKQPVNAERGYALVKQLVVFAYFTSEPVAKGLINAPIIPGRYDGCVST